jgi:hypothetical protein
LAKLLLTAREASASFTEKRISFQAIYPSIVTNADFEHRQAAKIWLSRGSQAETTDGSVSLRGRDGFPWEKIE